MFEIHSTDFYTSYFAESTDSKVKFTLDLSYSVKGFHYYYAISTDNHHANIVFFTG